MRYSQIFLLGFRATGKSSLGKLLAQKLKWGFVETDQLIVERSQKTISELTNEGSSWELFRTLEHEVFFSTLFKDNLVVSTGGGLAVNDVLDSAARKSFGSLNATALQERSQALKVILTAAPEVIAQRIRTQEMKRFETSRPILNERLARRIKELITIYHDNPSKQKEILVEKIIEDSLLVFKKRKVLYEKLSNFIIDTGTLSITQCVDQIIAKLNED